MVFYFFKQKTAYEVRISDWSSDVCSSDLELLAVGIEEDLDPPHLVRHLRHRVRALPLVVDVDLVAAVAAEHVGLGVHHRHEAHRHDQRDAEQALAAMLEDRKSVG